MELKSAIIFGSSGQDGVYLYSLLVRKGIEVIRVSRSSGDKIGSIEDYVFVQNIVKEIKPDYIFHFAAVSSVKHEVLLDNNAAISSGTLNILESVRKFSKDSRIFISGSALQFKNEGLPINESTPFDYSTPYAIARNYSIQISRYFRDYYNLKVFVGYFFNHDSPIRSESHINQKVVQHVKKILNGANEKLLIGDLNVRKEFNHAIDFVEAVWLLVNQDDIYEVVIGSGITYSIMDWVVYCFEKYSIDFNENIVIDKNFKSDYKILVSDPKLLFGMGWNPKYNFYQLAEDMLNEIKSCN